MYLNIILRIIISFEQGGILSKCPCAKRTYVYLTSSPSPLTTDIDQTASDIQCPHQKFYPNVKVQSPLLKLKTQMWRPIHLDMGKSTLPLLHSSFIRLSRLLWWGRPQIIDTPCSCYSAIISLKLGFPATGQNTTMGYNTPLTYNSPVYVSRYTSFFLSSILRLTHGHFAK